MNNHPKMLIIGNKIDLNENREVPKDEAIEYAKVLLPVIVRLFKNMISYLSALRAWVNI